MQRLFILLLSTLWIALMDSHARSEGQAIASGAQDTLNRIDPNGRKDGYWKVLAPKVEKPGYKDGQLIEEGRYNAGKRTGVWKRYWPNGKVMSEVTYTMGVPRGAYATYYPSGRLEEQGTWDLDRNTGIFKRWHPNGKAAQEFTFDKFGLRDGIQRYYHENGQLAVEVPIKQGRENGIMKRFYPNGDLQEVVTFNNGEMNEAERKTYAPKKPLAAEPVAADAKPAPTVSGEESTNALRFRENGYNTLYDKQLRISQTGEFKDGRLWNGRVYKYGGNGVLVRIEVYIDGRYAGNAPLTEEDLQ